MWNAGLDESQAGIKIVGRNNNNNKKPNQLKNGQKTKIDISPKKTSDTQILPL